MPPIHDYVIANQTGANTRSDLNNAFSAIVSNNSSATEPTTTYAYMWWADTGNDLLKQRNAADSAWISILTLSTGAVSSGGATEGTAVLSTGETGGTKYLREDGDGTSSWQSVSSDPAMGGDLTGTASNAQIAANAVGLAEMAGGTDGNLITYDASGDPAYVTTGTSGQILTSGGTGVAPTFQTAAGGADTSLSNLSATGENKVCQAWVNFNGTGTVAINDSHNVSSITDLNTGRYQVNFSNSMANVNYSAIMQAVSISRVNPWVDTLATGSFKIYIHQSTNDTYYDCSVNTVVFGD